MFSLCLFLQWTLSIETSIPLFLITFGRKLKTESMKVGIGIVEKQEKSYYLFTTSSSNSVSVAEHFFRQKIPFAVKI